MRIDIISAVPKLLESPFNHSIVKRAIEKGTVNINVHDLRDYSSDKHHRLDDYQYGGGAGMVLMAEPIAKCIEALSAATHYDEIIFMTPDGEILEQKVANKLSMSNNLLLLCGHYKGIDERIRQQYITKEISIGDYVLSGGELAAAVLADSIIRLIPGVLGDATAALSDSFQNGLLEPPLYSRPPEFMGMKVPDVLLSGNHLEIENWRYEMAVQRTKERKPNLLKGDEFNEK